MVGAGFPAALCLAAPVSPAHLEVPEAQFAAKELVLLPHVLLQVPEEAEGWQLWAVWTLMLQQLPGDTRGH